MRVSSTNFNLYFLQKDIKLFSYWWDCLKISNTYTYTNCFFINIFFNFISINISMLISQSTKTGLVPQISTACAVP